MSTAATPATPLALAAIAAELKLIFGAFARKRLGAVVGKRWVAGLLAFGACTSNSSSRVAGDAGLQPSTALARWDGGTITNDELEAAVSELPVALRRQFGSRAGRREFVDALVAKRLLAQEARRLGLTNRADIKRQVSELEERLAVQALLADALAAAGPAPEEELRQYYEANAASLATAPRWRVARVLLRGNPSDRKLRGRLEALRARALHHEKVDSLARLGDGPEREKAGDLGWVSTATDPLSTAALALRSAGDVSPVIADPEGLFFLVLTEREEARVPTFDEARPAVINRLAAVRERRVFDGLVHRLRAGAEVKVNEEAVR